MDCRQCAEDLTAFLDGELSKAASGRIQAHLQTCTSCSEELRSLQETSEFIESHRRELEPGAGSWNMVRARITTEDIPSPSHSWLSNRWRLAVAALAVMAALGAGTGYMQYQQTQKRELDRYISEYMQQREKINSEILSANDENPFIEVKEIRYTTGNPFRLEDR